MQRLEDTSTTFAVCVAVGIYSLCSSTLLLANKVALTYIPLPSVVSVIQIVSSTIFIVLIKLNGVKVDDFEWSKVKFYAIYIAAFVGAIYSNMQALTYSNVETVIVFRACSPIATTIIEYFLMDRALPSIRSAISLAIVAIGAIIYCLVDSELKVNGFAAYTWVIIYFVLITFEMTYGKKLTSSVKMDSVWGPVLYTNALAALPMFMLGFGNGEFDDVGSKLSVLPFNGIAVLVFSCVAGTAIGYMTWLCRGMVSATTFTLVGVVNKFLTLLLNVLIWDKHSSALGLFAVCTCLLAGAFYQQAPKRSDAKSSTGDDSIKGNTKEIDSKKEDTIALLSKNTEEGLLK